MERKEEEEDKGLIQSDWVNQAFIVHFNLNRIGICSISKTNKQIITIKNKEIEEYLANKNDKEKRRIRAKVRHKRVVVTPEQISHFQLSFVVSSFSKRSRNNKI